MNPEFKLELSNFSFAEKMINEGAWVLSDIYKKKDTDLDSTDKLKKISAFAWVIYHFAVLKGNGFEEGTFIIEDPKHCIYEFLKSYPFSYQRPSTHLEYIKKVTSTSQYGIDFIGEFNSETQDWIPYNLNFFLLDLFLNKHTQARVLPTRKAHMLFSQIKATQETMLNSDHIFIKLESNGLKTPGGFINHAIDLYYSRYPVQNNSRRLLSQVERVSPNLIQVFMDAMEEHKPMSEKERETFFYFSKEIGIRFMLEKIEAIRNQSTYFSKKIELFYSFIKTRGYDHLASRMGNEVIFTVNEIEKMLANTIN